MTTAACGSTERKSGSGS